MGEMEREMGGERERWIQRDKYLCMWFLSLRCLWFLSSWCMWFLSLRCMSFLSLRCMWFLSLWCLHLCVCAVV